MATLAGELKDLKKEEKNILEVLNQLKIGLNRLKVEELTLSSKLMDLKSTSDAKNVTAASKAETKLKQECSTSPLPDAQDESTVNETDLNLNVAEVILNNLAKGGLFCKNQLSSDEFSEEYDSDENIDNHSNVLSLFDD